MAKNRRQGFLPPDLSVLDPTLPQTPQNLFPTSLTGKGTRGNPSGKTVQINPNQVEQLAVQLDTKGYNLADQDFVKRFPSLVAGRQYGIDSSGQNLSGGADPNVTGALKQSGLGDINFGQGEFTKARNIGAPIASIEQRDRSYFQRLLANNPQRAFGLNSQDIAHIALANTGAVNVNNQGQFGSRLNQYLASVDQASQNQAALIGGLGSLAGAAIKGYGNRDSYLSGQGYGTNYPSTLDTNPVVGGSSNQGGW